MKAISKAHALTLLGKWERQNKRLSIFCFSPWIALSSNFGHVVPSPDEWIDLRLEDETSLRIFIGDAKFSSVEPRDVPAESINFISKFEQGIRVALQDEQMQWYLLV